MLVHVEFDTPEQNTTNESLFRKFAKLFANKPLPITIFRVEKYEFSIFHITFTMNFTSSHTYITFYMKKIKLGIVLLCIFSNVYTQVNLNLGLVAHWNFNGNANDVSGNGNNGTVFGATLVPGQAGIPNTAYYFNGSSSYIQVANSPTLSSFPSDSFTIYARIKTQGFYAGPCHGNSIVDKGNSDYINGWYTLRCSDAYSTAFLNCSSPMNPAMQNYSLECYNQLPVPGSYMPFVDTSLWDCVIAIYGGDSSRLYVNGVLKQTMSLSGPLGSNTDDLFIGRKNNPLYPYWVNGIIDDIRIYNRAINTQEIDSLCNSIIQSSSVTANFITSVPNGCDSSIIQFTDISIATNSTIVSWNWYFGDGNSSSSQNPLHNYTGGGTFQAYLVVTNSANQTDTFYQSVISIENPINIQGIANPTSVCPGSSTVFTASGANTYSWSGGVTNGVPFIPSTTATYTVTGTDINGCTNTATVIVTVNPLPNVGAVANPSNICPGGTTILTGSGASTYTWTNGVTNGVAFSPTATATYTVTGVDANGCSNTSSVTVSVNQNLPITVTPPTSILCLGDSVQLTASGATNYNWSILPGLSSYTGTSVFAYPTSTTTYTVTGSDATGCSGTTVVTIDVINEINISISKNRDAECNINTVQLQVIGAQNYTWTPANFLSNPTGSLTNATVAQTTTFYVTGTTGSCTDMDSIVVYHYNNDEASIFIPSAFSPNNDGNNDCLHVRHKANFSTYYFAIYNRWGERVFETDSPDQCWNGEFKNKRAESGTYYYYLKAETNCGKIFKQGDITLVR
jgi:gliding motility-associated-like protein